MQKAYVAGGCFWCLEAIFKRIKGIESVISGYSGGSIENPTYQQVCSGKTGHAETVEITFDPDMILFEKILEIFWHMHNPTTLNKQGNDVGTQYRSAIFFTDLKQKEEATRSKKELEKSQYYNSPIVTEIVHFKKFYAAENYHKDYYDNNQNAPYCTFIIDPKIQKLLRDYKKDIQGKYA